MGVRGLEGAQKQKSLAGDEKKSENWKICDKRVKD